MTTTKHTLFLILLCSLLISACNNIETVSSSASRTYQVQLNNDLRSLPTSSPTTIVEQETPIPTNLTPENAPTTPWPTSTQHPTVTPTPTATWWSYLPATPLYQVTPTALPSPSFTQSTFPIDQYGVVIFDAERQEKWEALLGPFPEWEIPASLFNDFTSDSIMVSAEFKPTRMLELNLDQDEGLEVIVAYVLVPHRENDSRNYYSYHNEGWSDYSFRGEYGLAVFDDNDNLLWQSETTRLGDFFQIELNSLQLSDEMEGILLSRGWIGGKHSGTTYGLYVWQAGQLVEVWSEVKEFYATGGVTFVTAGKNQIGFEDLDGDGLAEILVEYASIREDGSAPCCYNNYTLHFPGTFVYKWNGEHFDLTYLLIDDQLQPIRSQSPVILAPYVSKPIMIDGYFNDWRQVEYAIPAYDISLTYQNCSLEGVPHLVWDNEYLYLKFRLLAGEEITIAFDSNLEDDFSITEPNHDDVLLTVSVNSTGSLITELQSNNNVDSLGITTAVGEQIDEAATLFAETFPIEMSIPFELIGFTENPMNLTPGWGYESHEPHLLNPLSKRFYYPNIQKLIGLGIRSSCADSDNRLLNLSDPTSWGTLVLAADR